MHLKELTGLDAAQDFAAKNQVASLLHQLHQKVFLGVVLTLLKILIGAFIQALIDRLHSSSLAQEAVDKIPEAGDSRGMIARKITYTGRIDDATAEAIYDVVRKIEITGEVRFAAPGKVELDLEGDPSMIKLIQHQVERKVQGLSKVVEPRPYRNCQGLDFLR